MTPVEYFLGEHADLRSLMAAMTDLFPRNEDFRMDPVAPDILAQFKKIRGILITKLGDHEVRLDRFFQDVIEAVDENIEPLIRTVRSDHDSIKDIFSILFALEHRAEKRTLYSFNFILSSLVYKLERHFNFEEKDVFPLFKRLPASFAQ